MVTERPTYKLETFEGPLDLLLSLIEKHQLDIYDIEISVLTEQYIAYIESARENQTYLTAEFIEMASHLLYIKSRLLLPAEDEEEDPKATLEAMLIEYQRYKRVAQEMQKTYIGNLVFFRSEEPYGLPAVSPEYSSSVERITDALERISVRNERMAPLPMNSFKRIVGTKFVSVPSKIISVMKNLIKRGRMKFLNLFDNSDGRSGIVATFLAVLELLRHGRVDIVEDGSSTEIVYIGKEK